MDEYAIFNKAVSDGGVGIDELAGGEVAQIWNGGAGVAIDTLEALVSSNPNLLLLRV